MYTSLQNRVAKTLVGVGVTSILTGIVLASCVSGGNPTATPAALGTPSPQEIAAYAQLADDETLARGRQIYTQKENKLFANILFKSFVIKSEGSPRIIV